MDSESRVRSLFRSPESGCSNDGMFNEEGPAMDFLERLQYCPPLMIGFHAMAVFSEGNEQWCYCPCGKNMGPWREFMEMDAFLEDKRCDMKGRKGPNELVKHLEAKMKNCKAHRVVYAFLDYLFRNYHNEGIRHIAFEDMNTRAYKKALNAIMKKVQRQVPGAFGSYDTCDSQNL